MAVLRKPPSTQLPRPSRPNRHRRSIRPLPHRFLVSRWERQEIDLRRLGVVPIANLARFHALANGITISSTLDRLVAAEALGALDKETAQSLREAFTFIWQVRLDHHAQQIRDGRSPDNLIRPNSCRRSPAKSCARRSTRSPLPSSSSTDLFRSGCDLSDQDLQLPKRHARGRPRAACANGRKPLGDAQGSAMLAPPRAPRDQEAAERSGKRKPAGCAIPVYPPGPRPRTGRHRPR